MSPAVIIFSFFWGALSGLVLALMTGLTGQVPYFATAAAFLLPAFLIQYSRENR